MSAHFSVEELTFSSTAQRLEIDNTPPPDVLANLQVLMAGLEEVRALLNCPLKIDSGYRSPTLNRYVNGAPDSDHIRGLAADFICEIPPIECVKRIAASDIKFSQVINEGSWCHVAFAPSLQRQVLTAHFTAGGTVYTEGV